MKRIIAIAALMSAFISAKAENLEFSYGASADLVSCYIWRGFYEGGLSFQPDLSVGWESEHTSFTFGTWWSVGASDWCFRRDLPETEDGNPNTQFIKELDVYGSLNLWGVTLGFVHYYYLDGTNFFNFGDINSIKGTAQTDVCLGYDFSTLMPDLNLVLTWNTRVSGNDIKVNGKRAFSSYFEASYTHDFDHGISLCGVVGLSPWRSVYTDGGLENPRDFAFNNLTVRADKTWSLGKGNTSLSLFLQGTMNTCNLNKDNALIWKSGDDKLERQKLMGALGVRIAF